MDNWFSISKIDENTFAINEDKHWEETRCYLLCGTKGALLIDTGLGVANIKKVVDSLTLLPVMVATTHIHWDHIGAINILMILQSMKQKRTGYQSNFPFHYK